MFNLAAKKGWATIVLLNRGMRSMPRCRMASAKSGDGFANYF